MKPTSCTFDFINNPLSAFEQLSFLMSAVGSPGTMMMDEPSTGMDPAAKRFLW